MTVTVTRLQILPSKSRCMQNSVSKKPCEEPWVENMPNASIRQVPKVPNKNKKLWRPQNLITCLYVTVDGQWLSAHNSKMYHTLCTCSPCRWQVLMRPIILETLQASQDRLCINVNTDIPGQCTVECVYTWLGSYGVYLSCVCILGVTYYVSTVQVRYLEYFDTDMHWTSADTYHIREIVDAYKLCWTP